MKSKNSNRTTGQTSKTAIATAVALFAAPAMSQLTLEEVVVTAQKRQQTAQDVPSSVAAISEEMLARTNTRDFSDLNNITSGITITGGADGFGKVIRIRGVGTNSFVPAIRPAVGIFLNEVPLGAPESAYNNMADIERVEILKGPQATLFGKEVSSGAISLFTKRPDTEVIGGYVEGNYGNFDRQEYRLGGNLPLSDQFAIRASAYHNERDGMIENISSGEDDGATDADGYRVRLLWEASPQFNAILSYEDHEINVRGSSSVAQQYGDLYQTWEDKVLGLDPKDSQLTILDPFDRKTAHSASTIRDTQTKIFSLNVEWELSDEWSMTSVTSDQEYAAYVYGQDESSFINLAGENVAATADTSVGPYKLNNFYQNAQTDTFTQELRFTYESGKWSSIVGAFYAETDIISFVPFTSMLGALGPNAKFVAAGISDLTDDVSEWAVFTHNIYTIKEGLDLTFGVRYSDIEKKSVKGQLTGFGPLADLNTPPVPTTPWGNDTPTQQDSWDEITGTIKLTYWLNDELSMYGGWDRGFKAGGHNVCKGTEATPDCPAPFASELADNFEIGLKGRFLENTLVWNSAVFYQTYDDYQVDIQDDEGIGNSVRNAAKVVIQGIETDFQWLASDNFLVDGNISYVDAHWDEYENAGCLRPQFQAIACSNNAEGVPVQDLSGERLNYTSPLSANLNATWSDQLSNGMSWYVRGEYAFKDDRFFFPDLDPDVTDGSYFLFNASVGLSGEADNWDIILWGKNLTNEDYLIGASRNRDAGNPNFGTTAVEGYRVTTGEEATYGITLKYRLGQG
ncbi:MAG: iron complex outermembrane receptor protein [Halioglobus sp.]|jgi:iron complex outermembrane receptor protein